MSAKLVAAAILVIAATAAQTNDIDRARQLLAFGNPAEAAAIYRELARANPGNAGLLVNLSIAEYKVGRFHEAARSAAAALKLDPNLEAAHLFLGASLLETGDLPHAIESLDRFVIRNPNDRNARLMLGEALLRSGRAADAVAHLTAASELLPDIPRVWYALGKAYDLTGRKDEAAAAWKRLSELPPSFELRVHSAELNDSAQRWRDAAGDWQEALKLAPENRTARIGLAWSLYRLRDYVAAMAALKPLLSVASSADVPFLYGGSLLNLQQPAEAMPYLREALARAPQFHPAEAALGQAMLQTGKVTEAIPLLERAVTTDHDGSVHFQLFRAYQLAGRKADAERALAAYRRVRESLPEAR